MPTENKLCYKHFFALTGAIQRAKKQQENKQADRYIDQELIYLLITLLYNNHQCPGPPTTVNQSQHSGVQRYNLTSNILVQFWYNIQSNAPFQHNFYVFLMILPSEVRIPMILMLHSATGSREAIRSKEEQIHSH